MSAAPGGFTGTLPTPYRGFQLPWSLVSERHIVAPSGPWLLPPHISPSIYLILHAHSHSSPSPLAWAVLTLARVCTFLWLPKSLPLNREQLD